MTDSFAIRHGLADPDPISDEAPDWLREALFARAIEPLGLDFTPSIEMGRLSYTLAITSKPLNLAGLIENLSLRNRRDLPPNYKLVPSLALLSLLKKLDWAAFYGALEYIGQVLLAIDRERSSTHAKDFQMNVNGCFKAANVTWKFSGNMELERVRPVDLIKLESQVLKTALSPVAINIKKARGFLDKRPTDAANAIKESIAAIESYGRYLVPSASTLGEATRELRKQGRFPPLLLASIDKLYGFANSEAGVRHGSTADETVRRIDAEFVYATALAVIRYLQDVQ